MILRTITLQHFRNIALAELSLRGARQFFVGANGQGKTNLLEAAGFITALRSFRANESGHLIAHGQREAALACGLEHEKQGPARVVVRLRAGGKEVECDGERVSRLGEYLGRFPTVVFSSQDQQLVRGAPSGRRRWLDLTLAAMDAAYLRALQNYHRALAERNALLKRGAGGAELEAFEFPMAEAAAVLVQARRVAVAEIGEQVARAYAKISGAAPGAETAGFVLDGSAAHETAAAWRETWAKLRPRELAMRTTLSGPHRADVELTLDGRLARDFGSEGQQRSLVLALRLAQVEFFYARCGVQPVLLADDVLGELDAGRRERFWATLGPERQVIATGTEFPAGERMEAWQIFRVADGQFSEETT